MRQKLSRCARGGIRAAAYKMLLYLGSVLVTAGSVAQAGSQRFEMLTFGDSFSYLFDGSTTSYSVAGIDNSGQVAGTIRYHSMKISDHRYAFVARNGEITLTVDGGVVLSPPLYQAIDGTNVSSVAIAHNGVVLGSFKPWNSSAQSILISSGFSPPYRFFLTNGSAIACAIDGQSRVAGLLTVSNGVNQRVEGFVLSGTNWTTLGPLASDEHLIINKMNDHLDVVGFVETGPDDYSSSPITTNRNNARAILWRSPVLTDLNTWLLPASGWQLQVASAINNQGHIVGVGLKHGQPAGFFFAHGAITDLGLSGTNLSVQAINNKDQVVGHVNGRAFLWENGKAIDLADLAALPANWQLVTAVDINDSGGIVGEAAYPGYLTLSTSWLGKCIYQLVPVQTTGSFGFNGPVVSANDTVSLPFLQTDTNAVVLQASTNLTEWFDVSTNYDTAIGSKILYDNPPMPPARFYRLRK